MLGKLHVDKQRCCIFRAVFFFISYHTDDAIVKVGQIEGN